MANRGRQEFTTQEAVNSTSFNDWNYEELDLNDGTDSYTFEVTTNSSTTVTPSVANANIKVGMAVMGHVSLGIPPSSYITSVTGSPVTSFTINAAATSSATHDITISGGADSETSSYITDSNPAKKVVLYETPGSATSNIQNTDVLSVTINSKTLKLDSGDLPFTLPGGLITSLSVSIDQGNLTDKLSVLSFH